jgi:small-conductance mechanosensitive channel
MNNEDITRLPLALWGDLHQPGMIWQIAVLLLCLGIAFVVRSVVLRHIQQPEDEAQRGRRIGYGGMRRLLVPVLALVLVFAARAVMRNEGLSVNLLNLAVPLLLASAVIRLVVYAGRLAFGFAGWVRSFERVFVTVAWFVFALHVVGWLPFVIGGLESVGFSVGTSKLTLWLVLQGLLSVLVTLLAALWIGGMIEQRLLAAELVGNLRVVLVRVIKTALTLLAIPVALPAVGINLTTLSVFGGALGVGLGFGLQKIAANYVSGFILLLDRSIRIGNLISVGTERGVVSQITTRYTVLRGLTGVESIVPNETLIGSVVQNETFTDTRMLLPLDFQVAYATDLDQALALLQVAGQGHPRVLEDPPPRAYLMGFGDSGINLRLSVWIGDPQEGSLSVISEINLAAWRSFKVAGIEIPFPQREVRILGEVALAGDGGPGVSIAPTAPA